MTAPRLSTLLKRAAELGDETQMKELNIARDKAMKERAND